MAVPTFARVQKCWNFAESRTANLLGSFRNWNKVARNLTDEIEKLLAGFEFGG